MNRYRWIVRTLGVVAILSSFAIAVGGFVVLRANISELRATAQENILWSAAQLELELQRFLGSLGDFGQGHASADDVNARFDILWSRTTLFSSGSVGARLSAYDAAHGHVEALFAVMQKVESQVVGLAEGDAATAAAIRAAFVPSVHDLRFLSRDVLHGEEIRSASARDTLQSGASLLIVLSAASLVFSLIMLVVFRRETIQSEATARENLRLARAETEANAAKGRFLTMMSHELRTPLNGVLGMLGLLRATGLTPDQRRFVGQAEAAGWRVSDLLSHVIDFSDLQEMRLVPVPDRFDTGRLAASIAEQLEPAAEASGTALNVATGTGDGQALMGDERLIRQTVLHMALYLVEVPGLRRMSLGLRVQGGMLTVTLDCSFARPPDPRVLRLLLGPDGDGPSHFATEALGPVLARALCQLLSGSVEVSVKGADGAAVMLRFPVAVARARGKVAIETESQALAALCKAAVGPLGLDITDVDTSGMADVVLVDGTRRAARPDDPQTRGRPMVIVGGGDREDAPGMVHAPAEVEAIRAAVLASIGSDKLTGAQS